MGALRYSIKNVAAHKYCLLFSNKLKRKGNFIDNYWGFKHIDIAKELKRCSSIRCYYCGRKGASIYCADENCPVKFHLPCGIKNDSLHYYYGENQFQSFCKRHCPKPPEAPELKEPILCTICQETAEITDRDKLMFVDCCRQYFHPLCLIKLSLYQNEMTIKCPNCNNNTMFVDQLKNAGYWITKPEEIDYISDRCVANSCSCPFGREHSDNKEWKLDICHSCYSNFMHSFCMHLICGNRQWKCEHCN